jgi:hypothetical protein
LGEQVMDFEIRVVEPKQYVLLRVNSDITMDVAHRFTKELANVTDANYLYQILCDVRGVRNVSSIIENYKYAYNDVQSLGLKHCIHSAVLASPNDDSHNFIETVTQNAGYRVKIFRAENQAIDWLIASKQKQKAG